MLIINTFVRTLRFIGAYTVANVQAAMEYRISFWVQIFTMAANDSLWLFFWWTYFHQFPLVHGWQNNDIVVIWAVTACAFGIAMGFFGNSPKLAALIMNGGLDAYLGMPRYVLLHVCVSASDPTAWGDIIFAVGAFLLFLPHEHLQRHREAAALHGHSGWLHLIRPSPAIAPVQLALTGSPVRLHDTDRVRRYGGIPPWPAPLRKRKFARYARIIDRRVK